MSVLTLAYAKEHLNLTGSVNDAELQRTIDTAEAAISTRVGPLESVTSTVVVTVDGSSDVLVLPTRAVEDGLISLSTLGEEATADLTTLYLDADTGLVYPLDGSRFSGRYLVTYEAGFGIVPDDLMGAVEEMVRHLWRTQRGAGVSRPSSVASSEVGNTVPGAGFALPIRVEQMLEPHQSPRVA